MDQERTHRICQLLWKIRNTQRRIDHGLKEIREAWDKACLSTAPLWVYESKHVPDVTGILREARYKWKVLVLTKNGWEVRDA